jgi:hypothetical protein
MGGENGWLPVGLKFSKVTSYSAVKEDFLSSRSGFVGRLVGSSSQLMIKKTNSQKRKNQKDRFHLNLQIINKVDMGTYKVGGMQDVTYL